MAVKQAITNEKWQCLSTDQFPAGVTSGATLHIVDTGECYVFHDGMWTPDLRFAAYLVTAP